MMFGLGELVVDNNDLRRWKHHQLRLLHVCSKAFGPVGSDLRMGWKGIFFSGRHFTSLVHLLSISFSPHQEESGPKTISHQFWSEEIPIQQIHRITPRIRIPRKMFCYLCLPSNKSRHCPTFSKWHLPLCNTWWLSEHVTWDFYFCPTWPATVLELAPSWHT